MKGPRLTIIKSKSFKKKKEDMMDNTFGSI